MNIYLVGFMGTGKTSVGRELAKKKKCCFADLDELIELKEGRSISDIFSKKCEPYFRRAEKSVLAQVSRERNFVVACGGGVVINRENIDRMKESGVIVCLKATPAAILKRTAKAANRPLLNTPDPKVAIAHLLKLRAPYYALADKFVDTSKLSVKDVVARVVKITSTVQNKKR